MRICRRTAVADENPAQMPSRCLGQLGDDIGQPLKDFGLIAGFMCETAITQIAADKTCHLNHQNSDGIQPFLLLQQALGKTV